MKTFLLLAILFVTSQALHAEKRGIFVWITQAGPDRKLVANIQSDERDEQQRNISLKQATEILRHAKNWGSSVNVQIVADVLIDTSTLFPILQAISENGYLQVTYLVNGTANYPEPKETFLKRFQ
jgi:hypothetical protein